MAIICNLYPIYSINLTSIYTCKYVSSMHLIAYTSKCMHAYLIGTGRNLKVKVKVITFMFMYTDNIIVTIDYV